MKLKQIVGGLVVVVALAVCVTACRTTSSGMEVVSLPKAKVTLNSKIVAGYLEVVEMNNAMRGDLFQAQVSVMNRKDRDFPFEYRFRWLDKAGMEVPAANSAWMPTTASGKERVLLQGVAPVSEVADYILDIRFSQTSARW
jgi:uncharacterized protein YcfL